ncbi:hypothetical protein [Actinoplanes sp. L3-i22]|uniref:hypothetical protein n=1 Tax=Actinoplanes sp. L3-i22 TaxID=2836373 RepID=UPI001C786791|nr:hypothetical protein [Actinoplanes sp. L3-i22]BCY08284.1 hypothetical protein L3i22_033720 [Actinoplanes sp. L3-i22]
MVIAAVAAGLALSRLRAAEAGSTPDPSTSSDPVAGSDPVVLDSAPAGSDPSDSAPAEPASSHTTRPTSTHTTTTTTAPAGPVISYYRVSGKPSCPSGTDQAKFPGEDVTLEWKVTGADTVTLSVDGPGIYAAYDAKDSATLSFPCSGDPGSYQSHKYLLTASGPNGTKTRTLTVKAKVNEITSVS